MAMRSRQQNSRQAGNQVFGLGSSKFPGVRNRQGGTTLIALASLERRQNASNTRSTHS